MFLYVMSVLLEDTRL